MLRSVVSVSIAMFASVDARVAEARQVELAPIGKLRGAVIGIHEVSGVGAPIGKFIASTPGT
jgi:hypothetical protein